MDYKVRTIRTKMFTGPPSQVEESVNAFLETIEPINYEDIKVAYSDAGMISVVVVYKDVRKLNSM